MAGVMLLLEWHNLRTHGTLHTPHSTGQGMSRCTAGHTSRDPTVAVVVEYYALAMSCTFNQHTLNIVLFQCITLAMLYSCRRILWGDPVRAQRGSGTCRKRRGREAVHRAQGQLERSWLLWRQVVVGMTDGSGPGEAALLLFLVSALMGHLGHQCNCLCTVQVYAQEGLHMRSAIVHAQYVCGT